MVKISGTIKQGTTPTHEYQLPFDTPIIKVLRVSYSQGDKEIICKCEGDCTLEGSTISVNLSQEDTFKFECGTLVEAQLRILTTGNNVPDIEPIYFTVEKCNNKEVLV